MITFFSFIFLLLVVVFIHELGHFLAAKSVGMKVEKFYLGFNLFGLGIKRQIGETEYGLGLFPLGGYVKVAGIIDESMDDSLEHEPYEYQSKHPLQQIWFASAGVLMNLLLSVLIFFFVALRVGIGEPDPRAIVGEVLTGHPADLLGIKAGTEIQAINDVPIENWDDMTTLVHSRPDQMISVTWTLDGVLRTDSVRTQVQETYKDGKIQQLGMIGIAPQYTVKDATVLTAFREGVLRTGFWLGVTFNSVKMLFTGETSLKDIGGPVAIAQLTGEAARIGLLSLMIFMAIISVNLALLNFLPIPGLDGGHIVVSIIEGVIRRKLPTRVKLGILQTGLLFLLMLFVFILYNDISRIF